MARRPRNPIIWENYLRIFKSVEIYWMSGKWQAIHFFKKYGLGQKAIKEMVLTHMRERRRAQKVAKICESADTAGTISASESSSSNGSPPPSIYDKKRKELWRILTQVSTRTLHNICLGKCSALDFNSWWQLWRVELWVGRSVSLKFTVFVRESESKTLKKFPSNSWKAN